MAVNDYRVGLLVEEQNKDPERTRVVAKLKESIEARKPSIQKAIVAELATVGVNPENFDRLVDACNNSETLREKNKRNQMSFHFLSLDEWSEIFASIDALPPILIQRFDSAEKVATLKSSLEKSLRALKKLRYDLKMHNQALKLIYHFPSAEQDQLSQFAPKANLKAESNKLHLAGNSLVDQLHADEYTMPLTRHFDHLAEQLRYRIENLHQAQLQAEQGSDRAKKEEISEEIERLKNVGYTFLGLLENTLSVNGDPYYLSIKRDEKTGHRIDPAARLGEEIRKRV